jgi:hypothetical protein
LAALCVTREPECQVFAAGNADRLRTK